MSRSDPEFWDPWHEDSFKLDVESPLAISRSLWDEISQSDGSGGQPVFASTPATEITQDGAMLSHHDTLEPCCTMEPDSPRQKRRRMLLFPGADRQSSGLEAYESTAEDMAASPSSAWYTNADETYERPQEETWMTSWFNDSSEEQSEKMRIQVPVSQMGSQVSVSGNAGPKKWRKGVASGKSLVTGRRASEAKPSLVASPVASPVAYPFALLKPCGATGDVTLSDINQMIQAPRQKQIRRQDSGDAGSEGAGLSGKSVVALTKIHTEGNGSITIMRTKG